MTSPFGPMTFTVEVSSSACLIEILREERNSRLRKRQLDEDEVTVSHESQQCTDRDVSISEGV